MNCLSFAVCGVSAKLYHSNSCEKMESNPVCLLRLLFFSTVVLDKPGKDYLFHLLTHPGKKAHHFPMEFSECIYINRCRTIRIAGMPAGVLHIIIYYITRIPAKDHIAKPHTVFNNGKKFFRRNIFASQYSIDIAESNFYLSEG